MIKVPFMGRPQSVNFSEVFISGTVAVPDVDYVKDHFYLSMSCGVVVKLSMAASSEPVFLESC